MLRLALAVCVVGLVVVAPSSLGGTRNGLVVTVTYSGVLDESFVYDPNRPAVWQETMKFTWTERKTARVDANGVVSGGRSTITIGGMHKATYAPPNTSQSCTGTFSLLPRTPDPITIGTDSATATMPISPDYVKSSSAVLPCNGVGVSGTPFDYPESLAFGRAVNASCTLARSPCRFRVDSDTRTNSSSLRATMTVTRSSGSGTAPPPTTKPADPKAAARAHLIAALRRAEGPCLHLGISLSVLASGAVWTSVAAIVPGGIPAGGAVIATGAAMANATTPLCSEFLKQIVVAYSIWKKDPPVSKAVVALRLPSCARWEGALRSYCAQLSAALTKLVAAERRVLPALQRLQSDAGRLAAARDRGDTAAVAAAQQRVATRVAAVRTTRAAARAAGESVAAIVSKAGVRGRVDAARSAAGAKALAARLAALGVPSAELPSAARETLRGRPVDMLATLRR